MQDSCGRLGGDGDCDTVLQSDRRHLYPVLLHFSSCQLCWFKSTNCRLAAGENSNTCEKGAGYEYQYMLVRIS